MKRSVITALALGFAVHAPALEMAGPVITLSPLEAQTCEAEGGCVVVTAERLRYLKLRAMATECRGVDVEWRKGRAPS